jgi:hypothetical protein
VAITWEPAYPERYEISTSLDGVSFTPVARPELDLSRVERAALEVSRRVSQWTSFAVQTARYVRISSLKRASRYGISIWDASVYGPP